MSKKLSKSSSFLAIAIVSILVLSAFLTAVTASNIDRIKGFDSGPSYESVVPLKKTTFVNFDENTYLDDYAYLAAVPTAVFKDGDNLYSNPLLFYQDEYPQKDEKDLSLNAREGIDYFMEDWMAYSNGQLDQMTLINVPKNKLDSSWKAKEYTTINSDNPYDIASQIALSEWSYSDNAVVSVVDNFEEYIEKTEGKIEGSFLINKDIKTLQFKVPQTNKLDPQFNEFTVPDGYVYLKGRAWYSCLYLGIPGVMNISIPSGDKDLQLYCKYDGDWMQVEAVDAWNAKSGMDKDYARCYVYKPGEWLAGITDVPTKKIIGHYGSLGEILANIIKGVTYKVDIEMYPGAVIPFDIYPPYYCRDAEFKFQCKNSNAKFGFLLIGPSGEKILNDEDGVIKLDKLGQCLPGEHYQFAVYTEDPVSGSYDYEITYSWDQNQTKAEGDSLTSATEGAVLASMMNAPLLYTPSAKLSNETKNVLYKLGVKNIYLINLGDHISRKVVNEIGDIADITEDYKEYRDIYDSIRELSGNNTDVVFSTVDSWSYWYATDLEPAGEKEGALFIGPAAYIAAQHGTPVVIVDNHPELSSAVVWHDEFWRRNPSGYVTPTVAEMYLTGKRVCSFFDKYGFKDDSKRAIITVADQYDIGASWDRMFVGRGTPGRFAFSPVDMTYWISRSVFYPALIFVNPAMNPDGIELINGSKSIRGPFGKLKIIKPSGPEDFEYPILQSYMPVYLHRFNERASKYWGFTYQCADGITPYFTNTLEAIDDGVNRNEVGSFWPDVSESEDVPFYLSRGGYSNVFSTSFSPVMEDLNKGCIMWIVGSHGSSANGGELNFHDPDSIFHRGESNPWRGYEWYLGSTEEPDTMTLEIHGIIPALLGNPDPKLPYIFRTALDWAPAKKPILDKISILANLPLIRNIAPSWLKDTQDYYDGIVGSSLLSLLGTKMYNGYEIDAAIENIHSCGFITAACLPAYKYLHLAMVRHGSSFQIIDPWGTSWYSSFWEATIPRDIVLGDTVGEAYVKGMSHVGILYISDPPQWWWDLAENVCYFGDPDMRVYVPGTDYSDANHWEQKDTMPLRYDAETSIAGHMPYGATNYPNEREPMTLLQQYIWLIALILVVILAITAIALGRKKKR